MIQSPLVADFQKSLLPPSALARIQEFPDLVKTIEDVAVVCAPSRKTVRLIVRLCRVSVLATSAWVMCVIAAVTLGGFLIYGYLCAVGAVTPKQGAAASMAILVLSHLVYASVRMAAKNIAEEIKESGHGSKHTRIIVP